MNVTYIDYKTTVWQRIKLSEPLPEEKLAELKQFLGTAPCPNDAYEVLEEMGFNPDNSFLDETEEAMSVEDNNGNHTVEFYNDNDEMLWTNKEA